jgi:PadR family transcriptional regulator
MADLSYRVGQMSREPSIGQFEQLVLTAILAQRDDAYGVTIHAKVAELVAPKSVSLGATYVTLDRLEDKGLISSWLSKPTAARGGRAKRCYQLEALGERALQASAATIHRMHEVLVDEWGGRPWKPARAR